MRVYRFLFIVSSFTTVPLFGQQKIIYDSLLINFGRIEMHLPENVDTVRDHRSLPQNCVGIEEKTKYVFIPVDNLIVTKKPLSREIQNIFAQSNDSSKKYRLEINEFSIDKKSNFFRTNYICNAAISIYVLDSSLKPHYLGALLYENSTSAGCQKKYRAQGYENAMDDWKMKFTSDFQEVSSSLDKDLKIQLPNFRKELNATQKNMLINTELFIGKNSWVTDGEIIFSRPEAQTSFFRQAYSLRYRNEVNFEAFETSIYNRQKYQRLSSSFILTAKSKFFIGFNRWKGDEYKNKGLQDIFIIDFSSGVNLVWNRFYKNGITLGVGLMGNITYLVSEDFAFKPYGLIQIGIKL